VEGRQRKSQTSKENKGSEGQDTRSIEQPKKPLPN